MQDFGNFDMIKIGLASPEKIKSWSRGEVKKPETIKLDWENAESRWIDPGELHKFQTVPGLEAAWAGANRNLRKVYSP